MREYVLDILQDYKGVLVFVTVSNHQVSFRV